ncbi:hypothetical protein ACFSC4_01320 [Deinococcus malanensis]
MASFTELSTQHVLPEGALLPSDALPPSPLPDGPVPSGVRPGELTRMMNAAMLPPGMAERPQLASQNREPGDTGQDPSETDPDAPAEDATPDGVRVKSQQFL